MRVCMPRPGLCRPGDWRKSAVMLLPAQTLKAPRRHGAGAAGAGGEPSASAGGVRRAAGSAAMIQQQERIGALCEQLQMACLSTEWPAVAHKAAQEEASFADFLEKLLGCELAAREQRKRSVLLKLATLSSVKTLEQFDWNAAGGCRRRRSSNSAI